MKSSVNPPLFSLSRYAVYFLLFLIPLLTCYEWECLHIAKGPSWLGRNIDPTYAYLLNALKLTQFKAPNHIDHPGTPLQVFSAVTIAIVHLVRGRNGVVDDVLYAPETYITVIQTAISLFALAALFLIGLWSYNRTQRPSAALWVQSAPLLTITCFEIVTYLSPDALLFICVQIFSCVLLVYVFPGSPTNKGSVKNFARLCGIGVGFLLSLKITSLPLIVIPAILLYRQHELRTYLSYTAGAFLLFIAPALTQLPRFISWFIALSMHSGHYGTGPVGILSISDYPNNLIELFRQEWLFAIVVGVSLIVDIISFRCKAALTLKERNISKLLAAITTAQIIQFLLVAKHPGARYLIPSLALVGLNLALISLLISRFPPFSRRIVFIVLSGLFVLGVYGHETQYFSRIKFLKHRAESHRAIADLYRRHYGNIPTIYSYDASALEYALAFGNKFAGNYFSKPLEVMFPGALFYNPWRNTLYRFDTVDQSAEHSLRDISVAPEQAYILRGAPSLEADVSHFIPFQIHLIEKNDYEGLYLLKK